MIRSIYSIVIYITLIYIAACKKNTKQEDGKPKDSIITLPTHIPSKKIQNYDEIDIKSAYNKGFEEGLLEGKKEQKYVSTAPPIDFSNIEINEISNEIKEKANKFFRSINNKYELIGNKDELKQTFNYNLINELLQASTTDGNILISLLLATFYENDINFEQILGPLKTKPELLNTILAIKIQLKDDIEPLNFRERTINTNLSHNINEDKLSNISIIKQDTGSEQISEAKQDKSRLIYEEYYMSRQEKKNKMFLTKIFRIILQHDGSSIPPIIIHEFNGSISITNVTKIITLLKGEIQKGLRFQEKKMFGIGSYLNDVIKKIVDFIHNQFEKVGDLTSAFSELIKKFVAKKNIDEDLKKISKIQWNLFNIHIAVTIELIFNFLENIEKQDFSSQNFKKDEIEKIKQGLFFLYKLILNIDKYLRYLKNNELIQKKEIIIIKTGLIEKTQEKAARLTQSIYQATKLIRTKSEEAEIKSLPSIYTVRVDLPDMKFITKKEFEVNLQASELLDGLLEKINDIYLKISNIPLKFDGSHNPSEEKQNIDLFKESSESFRKGNQEFDLLKEFNRFFRELTKIKLDEKYNSKNQGLLYNVINLVINSFNIWIKIEDKNSVLDPILKLIDKKITSKVLSFINQEETEPSSKEFEKDKKKEEEEEKKKQLKSINEDLIIVD